MRCQHKRYFMEYESDKVYMGSNNHSWEAATLLKLVDSISTECERNFLKSILEILGFMILMQKQPMILARGMSSFPVYIRKIKKEGSRYDKLLH